MCPSASLEFTQGYWKHSLVTYRKDYIIIKLNIPDDVHSIISAAFADILDRYFETFKIEGIVGQWGYFKIFPPAHLDPLQTFSTRSIK